MNNLVDFARDNRKKPTEAEKHLWYALRKHTNIHWQRQFPIGSKYIADLVCRSKRLIIECDGRQHFTDEGLEYDGRRDDFLKEQGYRILRFKNPEILKETEKVVQIIIHYLESNDNPPVS